MAMKIAAANPNEMLDHGIMATLAPCPYMAI
jgi:hypothetical protein